MPIQSQSLRRWIGATAMTGLALMVLTDPITPGTAAKAQGTPGLMEFRWDTDSNYRKLYYFQTSTIENDRSEWYLTLRAKDRPGLFRRQTQARTDERVPDLVRQYDESHKMPGDHSSNH